MIAEMIREPQYDESLSKRDAANMRHEYERAIAIIAPTLAVLQSTNILPSGEDPRTLARIALSQIIDDACVSEIVEMMDV